jgi:predicted nuclease of restriction endonuclease-like (RecB) superfamily
VVAESPTPLAPEQLARFSWTHFLEFIRIDDPWKRAFYENESLRGHWSKRQLQRQIESLLYERTGLSTNKKAVVERARKQEVIALVFMRRINAKSLLSFESSVCMLG